MTQDIGFLERRLRELEQEKNSAEEIIAKRNRQIIGLREEIEDMKKREAMARHREWFSRADAKIVKECGI